jgi:hypothetical protein
LIDNVSSNNEKLIKFGNSNNLRDRVVKHRETYLNFRLVNAFKVENKLQIENAIKKHALFVERNRPLFIKNKRYVEILSIEGIDFDTIDKTIRDIITSIEYSPSNYVRILDENNKLKQIIESKNFKCNINDEIFILKTENTDLKLENIKLINKYNTLKKKFKQKNNIDMNDDIEYGEIKENNVNDVDETIKNYASIMTLIKSENKRVQKNENGKYEIGDKIYDILIGTREEVWNEQAYKTAGCLLKTDLMMNSKGLIISKKKFIQEKTNNKFETINLSKSKKIK